MRLWTFQSRAVLEALRERGRLEVDLRHKGLEQAPRAYRWLALEMRARIAGHQGKLPWWLHVGPPPAVATGPTGRAAREDVLLEFEIDPARVIVLRKWAWSRVVDGCHLARSMREEHAWRRDCRRAGLPRNVGGTWFDPHPEPLPEPFETRLVRSFQNLFDPRLPARAWRSSGRFGYSKLRGAEAVTEVLELEALRNVHAIVER